MCKKIELTADFILNQYTVFVNNADDNKFELYTTYDDCGWIEMTLRECGVQYEYNEYHNYPNGNTLPNGEMHDILPYYSFSGEEIKEHAPIMYDRIMNQDDDCDFFTRQLFFGKPDELIKGVANEK
ncbi:hypothetical protein [Carboxylicivirga sp. N1Y90]|uniref:hypothetical protein n=1 Tax=Carboxylicivirga fragile TaxID=3417571 RepID=UPI003D34CF4A|nr:hypothetical protein [Marinilabiliaceae bacterium N1Y90]